MIGHLIEMLLVSTGHVPHKQQHHDDAACIKPTRNIHSGWSATRPFPSHSYRTAFLGNRQAHKPQAGWEFSNLLHFQL